MIRSLIYDAIPGILKDRHFMKSILGIQVKNHFSLLKDYNAFVNQITNRTQK